MRYLNYLKKGIFPAIFFFALLIHPMKVNAVEAPYTTLTQDKDGHYVNTQTGYIPFAVYDKFGEESLKKPSDLFLSTDGKMYLADTGNHRILICDRKGNLINSIEEGLMGPTGIYVDEDGTLYAADPKAKMILVYSKDGNLIRQYETPVSPLFAPNSRYAPSKLVANLSGSVYALSEGNENGILTFGSHGDFYGYFGANNTNITFKEILRRIFFTEEMKNAFKSNVPSAAINLDIDRNGLIYTVTQGADYGGVKKFNMAGKNILPEGYDDNLVTDIAVGDIENIFTITNNGYIYEYSREHELLFLFGGKDDGKNRTGLFIAPAAIDVDEEGNLYVLDSETGSITVFEQTEYAKTVHTALNLFQEGYYIESREPWEEVLRRNSLFDYANRGIGKAYYRLEQYADSMEAARLGGDKIGYSDAFWEIRNTWLQQNVVKIFFVLLALVFLKKLIGRIKDKAPVLRSITKGIRYISNKKLVKELAFLKYMPKNPADAYYGIKKEGKVSIRSSTIVYLLYFVIYVINKYYSGFLFKTVEDGYYEIGTDMLQVFGVFALCMISNHLICSIRDGEGSAKNIYCAFAYCLMPYIFLKPVVIVLSHFLTYNESFIIAFMNFLIVTAIAILVVVMIKEIQSYTYRETFTCIFLTIFTMLLILAAGFIIFALIKQVMDFIVSIVKEGYYRGK